MDLQSKAARVRNVVACGAVALLVGLSTLFAQSTPLPPAVQKGVAWLSAQVQSDGSLADENGSIATSLQSREESLVTLSALASAPAALIASVSTATADNTEYLAREILAASSLHQSAKDDVTALLAAQNSDGGWGLYPGYQSDALDTALALQALQSASASSSTISAALNYLAQAKQADGGWGINGQSSIYVTANVLLAVSAWSNTMPDSAGNATAATTWLLAARNANQDYGDPFDNTYGLLSLSTQPGQSSALQSLTTALNGAQLADGSWAEDPYLTALALRGLTYTPSGSGGGGSGGGTQPGSVIGRVIDGASGYPLANIPLTLIPAAGGTPSTGVTQADGSFKFDQLNPGQYNLQIAVSGFLLINHPFAVAPGEQVNLGSLSLVWSSAPVSAIVRGQVVDASTGVPLASVVVSIGSLQATTDALGRYEFVSVTPGTYALTATLSGYVTEFATVTVQAGNIAIYSLRMTPGAMQPASGRVFGQVTHATDGSPFQVRIYPTPGGSFVTNADGTYSLATPPGSYSMIIPSYWGNDQATAYFTIAGNEQVNWSPKLYGAGQSPFNANSGEALLHVVDAKSGAPISGASVRVDELESVWTYVATLTSDSTGLVDITGLKSDTIQITVSAVGYSPRPLIAFAHIPLLQKTDLGNVGLTGNAYVLQTFPDLRIDSVDGSALQYDAAGTGISGSLNVTIGNHGPATTSTWFNVVAFLDLDGNDTFNAGDTIVGTARIDTLLAQNGVASISVPVSGSANFSHAPVKLFIDSEGRLNELDTWNNIGSSASTCAFQPKLGTGQPVLKWQLPNTEIMNVPVVAPLLDTNGDGAVNELDKRAIIVVTFNGFVDNASGTVRALDAETGQQLWAVNDPTLQARASGHVAIGDIDGDGKPEIVYYRSPDNHVVVLDNQGHLKWTAPYPAYSGSYNYTGPALADLNEDGHPAVLVPGAVLNGDGTLRFTYPLDGVSNAPEAVDLYLNGKQDVVIGNRAFDPSGNLLWTAPIPSMHGGAATRIGADPHPTLFEGGGNGFGGNAYATSYTGQPIWNVGIPVAYGATAPPSVGDTLGDGMPEIGFVTYYKYAVLRGDGSLLWSANIGDDSGGTAAAMFDFSGSGHLDVVYANNYEIRVMDGRDGHTIYSLPHGSDTASEYPVVADIDRSGHASLLVVGDVAPNRGLSVYGPPADGKWPGARAIWNQYAYNMDNVNDDGSIPAHPGRSWLEHNTFRANVVHFPNALADLEVDGLTLVDNGVEQLPTVTVRVGNAGLRAPPRETFIDLYRGDPAKGGTKIGHDRVRLIPAGTSTSFTFKNVPVSVGDQLFAIVDQNTDIEDCNRTNNVAILNATIGSAPVSVSVSTDRPDYATGANVLISAVVKNLSTTASDFRVHFAIADATGNPIAQLGDVLASDIAGGASQTVSVSWTVAGAFAGTYQVTAQASPVTSSAAANGSATFVIDPDIGAKPPVTTLHTDKQTYNPTDQVQIASRVLSVSANTPLSNLALNVSVYNAGGVQQFTHSYAITQLLPGASLDFSSVEALSNAPPGVYTVKQDLLDSQGHLFNHVETTYTVSSTADTGFGLVGTIVATPKTLPVGATLTLNASATNLGNADLTGVPLTITIVEPVSGQILQQFSQTSSLARGVNVPFTTPWVTKGQPQTTYSAVLSAAIGSGASMKNLTLAVDTFTLTLALQADVTLKAGTPSLSALALIDPTTSSGEITRVTNTLSSLGYSTVFVNTPTDFATGVRSGSYQLYLLFGTQVTPDATTQRLLREAVHRGEGLITASGVAALPDALAQISGLKASSALPMINAQALDVLSTAPGGAGHTTFTPSLSGRIVVPTSAQPQALFTGRLPATPDQGTLSDEVASLGRIDIGYFGTDTTLSLTSVGRIHYADGTDHYSVWHIRNGSDTAHNVTLASVSGSYSLALTIAAHTDTFMASPIVAGTADHTLSENGTTLQATSALTTVFTDPRLVDVGDNPGAIALWANVITTTDAFDWTGAQHVVHGAVHSNSDLQLSGAQNLIDGPLHYVTRFSNSGSQNSFTFAPRQVTPQPLPTLLQLDDYKPNGPVATAVGASYFDQTAECTNKQSWHRTPKDMPLAAGVYYIPCAVQINGDSPSGNVTLVSTGAIQIDGSKGNFTPFYQGLQFATTQSGDAIKLSGSNTQVGGLVFAPKGTVTASGDAMAFQCSVIADQIRFAGSKTTIDARNCAYATVQRQTPAVLFNTFGSGVAAYAAFDWQGAIGQYEPTPGILSSLFGKTAGVVAPTQNPLRAGTLVPLTTTVQSLNDPFQGALKLAANDDAIFNPLTATWPLDFTTQNPITANSTVRLGTTTSTLITATVSAKTPIVVDPLKQATLTVAHIAGESISDLITAITAISGRDAALNNALAALQAAQTAQSANDTETIIQRLLDAAEACGQSSNVQADVLRTRIDWVVWAKTH